jgi:hypothetical protein
MALVNIKGHVYYTKSVRRGKKVTSKSYGSGELAGLCAYMDWHDREIERYERALRRAEHREAVEARRNHREELRSLRERLASTHRAMGDYHRHVGRIVVAILGRMGYHQADRSRWRRRRMSIELVKAKGPELVKIQAQDLERLIQEADRAELRALAGRSHLELWRRVDEGEGDLTRKAEWLLAQTLCPAEGAMHRDAVLAGVALLKMDLAPIGSSLPEQLLAERAAVCKLHVDLLELSRADLLNASDIDYRKAEALDRWLSRAQARYVQALTALAKVRRLKLPIVVNQVNVGARVNGVRVAGE